MVNTQGPVVCMTSGWKGRRRAARRSRTKRATMRSSVRASTAWPARAPNTHWHICGPWPRLSPGARVRGHGGAVLAGEARCRRWARRGGELARLDGLVVAGPAVGLDAHDQACAVAGRDPLVERPHAARVGVDVPAAARVHHQVPPARAPAPAVRRAGRAAGGLVRTWRARGACQGSAGSAGLCSVPSGQQAERGVRGFAAGAAPPSGRQRCRQRCIRGQHTRRGRAAGAPEVRALHGPQQGKQRQQAGRGPPHAGPHVRVVLQHHLIAGVDLRAGPYDALRAALCKLL